MKILFCILLVLGTVFSCQTIENSRLEDLFEVDRKFSQMAEEKGYAKAFTEYAHPDAVLLRKNSMPVTGKQAIEKLFGNQTQDNVHFSWQPINGNIATSGELGYTYGVYTLKTDAGIEKGTYVSIWKKDKKGEWKYILDAGNEGIGE
ncbi:MAG: DUF4440 domain-containing protein [Prolixibacteraceae bacterium]|nr:DUF4440 domain-containing protein [Prolixibacteraceae bacterium]